LITERGYNNYTNNNTYKTEQHYRFRARTSLSSSATCAQNTSALFTCVFSRKVVNAGGENSDDNNA